ncbi:type VII secretion-associated serine protease mycosin [Actinomadura barringtoniae]|uniref:Type VII secretion-associated serine protease mycosin n=1 Tax=Actinomadura barringtoniae TaxID=1427535 RepID=A0A939T8U3_9ACTN|nr:type VII secretion-associated serine protease mycosin [Actinomadura barringtoniae]MBO2447280.1 type VII secretion-associated serine protease mycosin [Actinomadura barringtoniae]
MRTAGLATACGCAALTSLAIFGSAVPGVASASSSASTFGAAQADSRPYAPPTPKQSSPPPAAQSDQSCQPETKPEHAPTDESWAQKRLGFERVWPLTQGQGVTVAVIDSGVQPDHPMLAGRVPPGQFIDLTHTGKRDCAGHGTQIASLIGGRNMIDRRIPLSGVAPASRLLIIKLQNQDAPNNNDGALLPAAIHKAVDGGARVINMSLKVKNTPELLEAVHFAQKRNVVLVAAGGNQEIPEGENGKAYPASYPGVISVASLDRDGARAESSTLLSKVDVAAPGKDVYAATMQGGYDLAAQGTSYAAAFVSGVAALVISRHPDLSADQVVHRIVITADGNVGDFTGRGMVDPMQAVTAVLPEENGPASAPPAAPARFAAPAPSDHRTRNLAVAVTGGALGLAGLAAVAGVVLPMGRRRGWRAGRVTFPLRQPEEEVESVGPDGGTIGSRS